MRREFEVAWVKPTARDPGPICGLSASGQLRLGTQIHGDRVEYLHMTLRQLVSEAYRVQPFQIVCPDWFLKDRFDVLAKMPEGARAEEARGMLQLLLEDRFGLTMHRESRELAVTALVIGPNGAKLKESAGDPAGKPEVRKGSFSVMSGVAVRVDVDEATSTVRFDAWKATMGDLARFLMNFGAGGSRPVVDLTGLTGAYDIQLEMPVSMFRAAPSTGPGPGDEASEPGAGPVTRSLKRHGLELKNTKAPVEHLVVDRAERTPREN